MMENNIQIYVGGPLRVKKFRDIALYKTVGNIIIHELGYEAYLPHIRTAKPGKKVNENHLYKKNIQALNSSSFAIFEVTHPSHGVGMEIQYALLNKIPFLCIAKEGSIISKMVGGSIKRSQLLQYSTYEELKTKLLIKIKQELHLTEMNKLGKFITVEGIDYTGKSAICKKIEGILKKQKRNVILVSDPPLIQPWQEWKQIFETKQKISKLSEAFLLLSTRLDIYERVIKSALRQGDIVISDRYIDSWFAYQSYELKSYFNNSIDDTIDFLIGVNNFLFRYFFLSIPDLTILIVDEPQETLKRAKLRNSVSKYENPETQKAVQGVYLKMAKKFSSRFRVIDARGKDLDAVFEEVYNLLNDLLGLNNNER